MAPEDQTATHTDKTMPAIGEPLSSSLELLASWIESERLRFELPGVAAALLLDGQLSWWRGFGYADLQTQTGFDADTGFRIASISKLFTATAILQLRDRGLVDLNAPVVEYLPWFVPKHRYHTSRKIAVRHLLTHTAGLPREAGAAYWNDYEHFPSREELHLRASELETVFAPETHYKYSNLGLAVAGEIIAAVAKQPYEEFLQQNLLSPLGLHSTTSTPHRLMNLARGYFRREHGGIRREAPFLDCRGVSPAANVASTIRDLARFLQFHFTDDSDAVLCRETRTEMQRVHWLNPDWASGRGLGFSIRRLKDVAAVGHEGWVMGYRSQVLYAPDEQFVFIVLINADDVAPAHFYERAVEWLTPSIRRWYALQACPAGAVDYRPYAGRFRNSWADLRFIQVENELHCLNLYEPDPAAASAKLIPVSMDVFRLDARNGSLSIGEKVVFERDNAGRIYRVKMGDTYALREE